ncbi:MAG: YabP/YqfC family sporulation protein [Clostridiales bacterium]|jgi:sporulation protein YqfC|nr:YabP/YqfC family sporulation protein [Clostridiales bacterium]
MIFADDLKGKLGTGGLDGGKIIIFGGGVYVEGHKGLTELSEACVVFRFKKKRLRLQGIGFRLTCISNDSASVSGRLTALSFEE